MFKQHTTDSESEAFRADIMSSPEKAPSGISEVHPQATISPLSLEDPSDPMLSTSVEKDNPETVSTQESVERGEVLSTLVTSLPGYLHWEDDMEMVSTHLQRKVSPCMHSSHRLIRSLLIHGLYLHALINNEVVCCSHII